MSVQTGGMITLAVYVRKIAGISVPAWSVVGGAQMCSGVWPNHQNAATVTANTIQ